MRIACTGEERGGWKRGESRAEPRGLTVSTNKREVEISAKGERGRRGRRETEVVRRRETKVLRSDGGLASPKSQLKKGPLK